MTIKVIELVNELYLLDSIQDQAVPTVEVHDEQKAIRVTGVWVSSHYDTEEEVPSACSVAQEVSEVVEEHYPDYQVEVEIYNVHGQKETFNNQSVVQ